MENKTISVSAADIEQIKSDLEFLKQILLNEGELSEYAKELLVEARTEPEENYTPLEAL